MSEVLKLSRPLRHTTVQDLGVWLGSEHAMQDRISRTDSSCFVHLRRLRHFRGFVYRSTIQRLDASLVISSPLLQRCAGCTSVNDTRPPLRILNVSVHLVAGLSPREHVTEQMNELLQLDNVTNFKLRLRLVNVRNTFVPLSIFCYLTLTDQASSSCEWSVRHLRDKNCFR